MEIYVVILCGAVSIILPEYTSAVYNNNTVNDDSFTTHYSRQIYPETELNRSKPKGSDQEENLSFQERLELRKQEIQYGGNTRRNILVETQMLVPQMVSKNGYPSEEHTVYTQDGYILQMHRIPWGRDSHSCRRNRQPVFLMHGLFQSSAEWVLNGPDQAMGYLLADAGYDVWMGNARGNRYSRKHITLAPSLNKFWDFTFHHIGYYDLPAMIDVVLNATGQDQLTYIGHSQGSSALFILLSERPEYNLKIKKGICLSAIAFLGHMKSPFVKFFALFSNLGGLIADMIGLTEFMPRLEFTSALSIILCKDVYVEILCTDPSFLIGGFHKPNINMSRIILYRSHKPAGVAVKQLVHYGQLVNSGKFRKFDFGIAGNLMQYKNINPPDYALDRVAIPIYIFHSQGDWLANQEDVDTLRNKLRQTTLLPIPDKRFSHSEVTIGINAREMIYDKVVEILKMQ